MKVYRYGLLPPRTNAELVHQQLLAAHRYRNTLVEIERGRRAAVREAIGAVGDGLALEATALAAGAAEEAAARAVKAERAAGRSRAVAAETRARLTDARIARKDAVRALRDARQSQRDDAGLKAALDVLNERANELKRSAREYCGAHWGSYLLVEAEMDAARKAPLYDGAAPSDPRFVPWDGSGRVGVQLQGGLDTAALFGDDRRVRVDPVDPAAWDETRHRTYSERRPRTTLHLRVGSVGRDPVWADFPLVMHRPLPPGQIKWAVVHCARVGPHMEWSLHLTVDETPTVRATPTERGAVAVDIGWRVRPDGLRVACWRGEDGAEGEILLRDGAPASSGGRRRHAPLLTALRYPGTLRAIRDDALDCLRATLVRFLAAHDVPEWLRQATRTLSQWHAPRRFAALAQRWRGLRFEGDAAAFRELARWRYHDNHLWEWESAQRQKSLRRRREIYRTTAADLATRYSVLVLEKFDLRKMARRPAVEDESGENARARGNRQLAATSILRTALVQAFEAHGGSVVLLPAQDTTRDCAQCGSREEWDHNELTHRCSRCGHVWDQDENACGNLLVGYRRERSGDSENPGPARDDGKENDCAEVRGGARTVPPSDATIRQTKTDAARGADENAAESAGLRASGRNGSEAP